MHGNTKTGKGDLVGKLIEIVSALAASIVVRRNVRSRL